MPSSEDNTLTKNRWESKRIQPKNC